MTCAWQGKLDMNALIAYLMDMLILSCLHAFEVIEHAFVFPLIMFMLRVHACLFVCVPHANVSDGTVSYFYNQHTPTVIVAFVIESELFIGVGRGGLRYLL